MAIIDKSTDYFRIKLYTGNNNAQTIAWDETDTNMKPDMLWIKSYAGATVFEHVLGDVVRGGGKYLVPNSTAAEVSNSNVINTFNTNGFSVGGATQVSEASRSYVAWGWKASNTTVTNTAGSIDSTVSVNAAAGFSIVKVSKANTNVATIGHGLGVTPKFIIGKDLDGVDNWTCYNEALGNGKGIYLNASNAAATASTFWNSTSPTSTLFTIGSDNTWNSPSIVFYCFADVPSFSKFGTYTGNGNADGPFVYTGFKPAFIIVKDTSTGASWPILDATISSSVNPLTGRLYTDGTNAIGTSVVCDTLSNGFKMRNTLPNCNASGNLFIYIAFAENPFVTSTDNNSIPTTAR